MAGTGLEPLAVRVTPRSRRNQVLGLRDGVVAMEGFSAAELQHALLAVAGV